MSNRKRGILIGAITGAILGALVAWVYVGSQPEDGTSEDTSPQLAPTDWVRLAIAILGVARQLGELVRRV
ncbi:MAG: hypothetical protein J7M34_11030 [Anaerolineae bacterium]|nr:hypothetical protein [Anaerolineae bacterium]